jgi:hypothetical protein
MAIPPLDEQGPIPIVADAANLLQYFCPGTLAAAVQVQLSGVEVYKVGDEPEKAVHVVGKTANGKLAGLKTRMVET